MSHLEPSSEKLIPSTSKLIFSNGYGALRVQFKELFIKNVENSNQFCAYRKTFKQTNTLLTI